MNWCEIWSLHKFNLELQKYHKADRDTILKSERAATDSFKISIYNILVDGFLIIAIFTRKNGLSENMIFDWMLFLELTYSDNSDLLCSEQSPLHDLFKASIFSNLDILKRSYGS